jgi:hypothetical protein
VRRQLGTMERAIVHVDDFSSLFIVVILRLVNGPPPEVLQQALAILQKRHPLLQVQIVREGSRYYFQTAADLPPIPLQVSECHDDQQWLAVTEAELDGKIDTAIAPLMRVHYLYSAGQDAPSEVVFRCHHTIMDAVAAATFCRELLTLCGLLCAGQPIEGYGPLSPVPPAETLYPQAFQGAGRLWRTAGFLLRQMRDEVSYRRQVGGGRRPPVHAQVHTRCLAIQLTTEASARFTSRARREGVTLNSGLVAAELLAVSKHLYQHQAIPLRAVTFTDLRPHLKPPVPPENLGSYFSMLQYTVRIGAQQDLWELARTVQQSIYRLNKRGDKFVTPLLTKALFQMMSRQRAFRMGAIGLSYADIGSMEPGYGPIRLVGMHGYIPNNNLGPEYSIFARLLFDRLWLDVFYMEEDMDRHAAQAIADEICRLVGDDQ